jgi:hypothetical protein
VAKDALNAADLAALCRNGLVEGPPVVSGEQEIP